MGKRFSELLAGMERGERAKVLRAVVERSRDEGRSERRLAKVGRSFDVFLEEQGLLAECEGEAKKQLRGMMKAGS